MVSYIEGRYEAGQLAAEDFILAEGGQGNECLSVDRVEDHAVERQPLNDEGARIVQHEEELS